MKSYPSIQRCSASTTPSVPNVYLFYKIDGSNLRFEWSKKRGWYKFGTRRRLFDSSDAQFGKAIGLFGSTLAPELDRVIEKNRWAHVVAFAEFWGPNSFAGNHEDTDTHRVDLIDLAVDKKGILPPRDYLRACSDITCKAEFLGRAAWGKDLVRRVDDGSYPAALSEGIVGKYMAKGRLVMLKAKTQVWKTRVKEQYPDVADGILNS